MPLTGSQHAPAVSRLNGFRLGAGRLNYFQPWIKVLIGGTDRTPAIRQVGFSVRQSLNGDTESCTLRLDAPLGDLAGLLGHPLYVHCGDTDTAHLLFGGSLLSFERSFEADDPACPLWDVSAVSFGWPLNRYLVRAHYVNTTLGAIVADVMAVRLPTWAVVIDPTLGATPIGDALYVHDTIRDVLDRLTEPTGASWYVVPTGTGGRALHVFPAGAPRGTALPIGPASAGFGVRDVRSSLTAADVVSRVWSIGGGGKALAAVPLGADTIPVDDASAFELPLSYSGLPRIVSGAQMANYTGRSHPALVGRATSVVGRAPGTPDALTSVQAVSGDFTMYVSGAMDPGDYRYRVTFDDGAVQSAAGSSHTATVHPIAPPDSSALVFSSFAGGALTEGPEAFRYTVTFVDAAGGESLPSAVRLGVMTPGDDAFNIINIPVSTDGRTVGRRVYRSAANNATRRLVAVMNNSTGFLNDTVADPPPSVAAEPAVATTKGQLTLLAIPIGPAGTVARHIYRTVVHDSVTYRHLTTLGNNTTTTYGDNSPDAGLGSPLAVDFIGGPGDTKLLVVETAGVPSSGWADVGKNVIRYGGVSVANGRGYLTGIPADGYGAITAPIAPETPVVHVPHLTGVGSLADLRTDVIRAGDPINVLWRVDAVTLPVGVDASFGFPLETVVSDESLNGAATFARGLEKLAQLAEPIQNITYVTRDQTNRPGYDVVVNVGSLSGTFTIQEVTLTRDMLPPQTTVFPIRTVTAAGRRFSFTTLLRQIRKGR